MIDYDTVTKFISSFVIPAIFVVTIFVVIVVFLWDKFGKQIKTFLGY